MNVAAIKDLITKTARKPLIFFGPSGSGKSTLARHVLTKYKQSFDMSVSCTTRAMRPNEQHGESYYFLSVESFKAKIAGGEMLEYVEYNSNYYGTPISELSRITSEGKTPVLDIDYNGVSRMIELFGSANSVRVFVNVTDAEVLRERLRSRKTETEESLNQRLAITLQELEYLSAHKLYTHMINNDVLEQAKKEVEQLVIGQYNISPGSKRTP